ncbi:CRISPR-associated helicase Cas3' [Kitasatospora herbaricolor]|uniref:CRISPR-associated helicase Cas3 n=1 Tax=Kitasatospora herbaricolor TaxID=68217 RepID=A0ABZ1W0I3_9ACTN|nr:CRISPR-associated helicase Cas3' [Kitasatospora herbaricolor]
MTQDDRWQGYPTEVVAWLGALWGKSAKKAGGTKNLLLSHMLDTAAVAELAWDSYLPPVTRWRLDDFAGGPGKGRRLFAWLCGIHDCGKATPAFQHVDAEAAGAVLAAGLTWDKYALKGASWRHDKAGGRLLLRILGDAQWSQEQIAWVWPLVAGHHGSFPTRGQLKPKKEALQGRGEAWPRAQLALVEAFTRALGYEGKTPLAEVEPVRVPSRAVQLQLSGFVVMTDWIASNEQHFKGIDDLSLVAMPGARERAASAWAKLGLRGGWGRLPLPAVEAFQDRFGHGPWLSQELLLDVVHRMAGPGLVIFEAPMGEGKTKAALAAAELLAARCGADGVFVGMPTQATADPMFSQVRGWLERLGTGLESQVALLHGKRMFNKEWRRLLDGAGEWGQDADSCYASVAEDEVDEYGMASPFGDAGSASQRKAPAEWFLGRLRGLLSPFAVGTIDQLLFAATRTKHVMLRMSGLVGKVVVLDEVHAADVYMSQFLLEGLWWLGQAGAPVILLSATLPPDQRRHLVAAYVAGAQSAEGFEAVEIPEPDGYPSVTAVWLGEEGPEHLVESTTSWREDLSVRVEILPEAPGTDAAAAARTAVAPADQAVVALLESRLAGGGCVLIIRNTVPRAQATFEALREVYGADVRLLHGRLHAGHRADRTQEALNLLGPATNGVERPDRLILVATQLAEQSFDVDADLLITDLAPVDLLLQRIGRLHRHDRDGRPALLAEPTVVVTGTALHEDGPPWMLRAGEKIYGRYLMLRTAAVVAEADGGTWQVPGQVPELVSQVYGEGDLVPAGWRPAELKARQEWELRQQQRRQAAAQYLLTRSGEHEAQTLEGLHYGGHGTLAEGQFEALVRDGERSVEVVLVRRDDKGVHAVGGRRLGPGGEVAAGLVDDVLAGTVRLPAGLTLVAEQELGPLAGWRDHPWLRYSRALVLDGQGKAVLGDFRLRYDDLLGLVVEGGPRYR